MREKVEAAIDKIRAGLKMDGGDIDLVEIKDKVVYVKLKGACGSCPMASVTLKNFVEANIRKEIPEIQSVQSV
jgi:Fe-S cluster biogenesis protein NfuA